jgi:hypothetical protein
VSQVVGCVCAHGHVTTITITSPALQGVQYGTCHTQRDTPLPCMVTLSGTSPWFPTPPLAAPRLP